MIPETTYEVFILGSIMSENKTFNNLKMSTKLTSRTLSRVLKRMEKDGLVEKESMEKVSQYNITEKGSKRVFDIIIEWYKEAVVNFTKVDLALSFMPAGYKQKFEIDKKEIHEKIWGSFFNKETIILQSKLRAYPLSKFSRQMNNLKTDMERTNLTPDESNKIESKAKRLLKKAGINTNKNDL